MRIGYVLRSLEDSGVTVYCLRLAEALRCRGHDVFLVSDGGLYAPEVERLKLRRHELPLCRNMVTSCLAARRLADVVRRERPDVLHANWQRAQLACHLASRRTGVPFVSTLHLVGIPDGWLYRRMTHWGERVIAPCREGVDYLKTRFAVPPERIRLIFHGARPEEWPAVDETQRQEARRRLGLLPDAPVLVCVARLEKVKGHDLLLAALAQARGRGPDLKLLLVGGGTQDRPLRELARTLDLDQAVTFLGRTDPHQALAAADAFVLASHKESFGLAPLEAMFSGRAVLRTASEGAADQILPGRTGEIVPVGNVPALAAALAALAGDPERLKEMGRAARTRALEKFTLEHMAQQVESVYQELL